MFGIVRIFQHWFGSDRVADMAERVAGRSRLDVWQRVKDRLAQLGPAESRGYLRSRAIGIVREETLRLVSQEGASIARWQEQIEAAALDLLIRSIAEQHQQRRPIGVRRAA
jgi:hypothetical protein